MSIDLLSKVAGAFGFERANPATRFRPLVYADVSDTADLEPAMAKALRVYNGSGSAVTLMCISIDDPAAAVPTPFTVAAGMSELIPVGVRRIKVTGSTGLITASAITTGIEIQILER